jgi:hypothetical protein
MDDQKMKIKIVVRPEDARGGDEVADRARRERARRNRWGLGALFALAALSVAVAFIYIGGRSTTTEPEDQGAPVAATSAQAPEDQETGAPAASVAADLVENQGGQSGAGDAGAQEQQLTGPGAGPDASAEPVTGAEPEPDVAQPPQPQGTSAGGSEPPPAPAQTSDEGTPPTPPATVAPPRKPASELGATPSPGAAAAKNAPKVAKVATKPTPGIARAQLTTRVVGREPVDTMRSPVKLGDGRNVYYFTEFRNLSGHTVVHKWEHDGQVVASIPFKVGGNRWRVYSNKRIGGSEAGDWRVSAVDKDGAVLASAEFVAE